MPDRRTFLTRLAAGVGALRSIPAAARQSAAAGPVQVSGVYPSLAMFNDEGECGTGAVVPWADRLWVDHLRPAPARGSSDKLYEVDARPHGRSSDPRASAAPTPTGMIHRESQQLFIGPYVIDAGGPRARDPPHVHARPADRHRPAPDRSCRRGVRRHDGGRALRGRRPLARGHRADRRRQRQAAPIRIVPRRSPRRCPGYHGKGLYSGQGRLVYANNGEPGEAPFAIRAPRRVRWPSGAAAATGRSCAATSSPKSPAPAASRAATIPATDPVWSIGWDHRSLILMLLDARPVARVPVAEGEPRLRRRSRLEHRVAAHPRHRRGRPADDDARHVLALPADLLRQNAAPGIRPRSTYLKVIGDFCRWNDRVVLGCDDTAKAEFLNTRRAKGKVAGPGQSQSNLWFVEPSRLDRLGPASASGAVWVDEHVEAGVPSDPFLRGGFERCGVHLAHASDTPVTVELEVDRDGTDSWTPLRRIDVPVAGYAWANLTDTGRASWVRARLSRDTPRVTVQFTLANADDRHRALLRCWPVWRRPQRMPSRVGCCTCVAAARARWGSPWTARAAARAGQAATTNWVATCASPRSSAPTGDEAAAWIRANVAIPTGVVELDAASVLVTDDTGRRWRLPKSDPAFDGPGALGPERIDREVCTERDLFNCHGTFYELPAENAGGFAEDPADLHARATHPRLLLLSRPPRHDRRRRRHRGSAHRALGRWTRGGVGRRCG